MTSRKQWHWHTTAKSLSAPQLCRCHGSRTTWVLQAKCCWVILTPVRQKRLASMCVRGKHTSERCRRVQLLPNMRRMLPIRKALQWTQLPLLCGRNRLRAHRSMSVDKTTLRLLRCLCSREPTRKYSSFAHRGHSLSTRVH